MNWKTAIDARLENEGVIMRPLEEGDREALRALVFDADIWRYFVARIDDEADLDNFIESGLQDMAEGKRAVFMVIDKVSGELAGSMCYGNMAEADRRLEIGWSWLGRAFRGRGVNRWAKLALLEYAFEPLGCERVEFKTDVLNMQARKGLLNIGAVEEGVLRSFNYMPDGRRRDAIYFSILRPEWPAVRERLLAGGKPPSADRKVA